MAFMMPVMKNNYDIYKDSRSRKSSECSNSSANGITAAVLGNQNSGGRRRKVSECKSESFATSPSHHQLQQGQSHRIQMQRCQSTRVFPRNGSRTSSHSSATSGGAFSPTRSYSQSAMSSPPKQHHSAAGGGMGMVDASQNSANTTHGGSQNDLTKFHLRLVDKLRKSFRKDSAKRS